MAPRFYCLGGVRPQRAAPAQRFDSVLLHNFFNQILFTMEDFMQLANEIRDNNFSPEINADEIKKLKLMLRVGIVNEELTSWEIAKAKWVIVGLENDYFS